MLNYRRLHRFDIFLLEFLVLYTHNTLHAAWMKSYSDGKSSKGDGFFIFRKNGKNHTVLCCFCRSLNMDCENQEKDKDGNPTATGSFNNSNTNNSKCQKAKAFTSPAVVWLSALMFGSSCVSDLLFSRHSDYRLDAGPVSANRSVCVSASHVLLFRFGSSGLHYLHCR